MKIEYRQAAIVHTFILHFFRPLVKSGFDKARRLKL